MAVPRRPLGPISGNRVKKKELTPYKRGQIVGAAIAGADNLTIVTTLKTPESTIRTTLCYDLYRLDGETIKRTSWPRSYNDYHIRRLVCLVRA
jgi:hypothetical protein